MARSVLARHTATMNGLKAISLACMIFALSACGGVSIGPAIGTVPTAAHGYAPAQASSAGRRVNGAAVSRGSGAHQDHGASWMQPDAKSGPLLYVADWNANVVDVYSYPKVKQVGQLTTDMLNPDGLCTDAKGNLFVVNNTPNANDVVEFAHGGTTPIQTLQDPGQVAVSCSVDPVTGNLAVTNPEDLSGGAGSVSIYTKATGTPTTYYDADMPSVYFCAYDDKGNLYLDGFSGGPSEGSFQFAEMAKGKTTFTQITLKGTTIKFPGDVVWDGQYVDVADQIYQQNGSVDESAIYRTTGSGGTVVSKDVLTKSDDLAGYLIDGKSVIGTNNYSTTAAFWKYPKSGRETSSFGAFSEPIGIALSK